MCSATAAVLSATALPCLLFGVFLENGSFPTCCIFVADLLAVCLCAGVLVCLGPDWAAAFGFGFLVGVRGARGLGSFGSFKMPALRRSASLALCRSSYLFCRSSSSFSLRCFSFSFFSRSFRLLLSGLSGAFKFASRASIAFYLTY